MLVEIIVAIGAYSVYRSRKKFRNQDAVSRPHLFNRRSDAIGAAGEAAAQAELRKTLFWLCGNEFYLHDGPLVIEHAPGTDYPTAEIEHLAVTPFGIFIFETKHWWGHIAPSTRAGKLTRSAPSGQTDERRSPIDQNRTKLRFLRDQLPPIWPVRGAGLFTSPEAVLDPGLSTDLLAPADLRQWLRMQRDAFAGAKPICVEVAKKAVLLLADDYQMALHKHKATVIRVGLAKLH